MSDTKFSCDYGKRKCNCKRCKQPIEKGCLRIAKVVPNFFDDGQGTMKQYHHVNCIFEAFSKARATTKVIEDASDLEGFCDLKDEDKAEIKEKIRSLMQSKNPKAAPSKKSTPTKRKASDSPKGVKPSKANSSTALPPPSTVTSSRKNPNPSQAESKDNQFREFRRLCGKIAEEASYNEKTNVIKRFLEKGSSGAGFNGDIYVILKLLLPGSIKRVYNVQSKQLVKLFSQVLEQDLDEMVTDLEQGDVSETVFKFFESSDNCPPLKKSNLTVHDVDAFLDKLSLVTKEDEQLKLLEKITRRCTGNDLKTIIRLIKGDLKIVAGPKHILDALDPNAHEAFKASKDLDDVINRVLEIRKGGGQKSLEVRASIMTPVAPMLAEACKSVEKAMKKCPNGMFSEIKYDGERVQLHMNNGKFFFFSRSLKPVLPHKVAHFEQYIPDAFPHGDSMILDSEVLLIDTKTGNPLPFGTLGVHKKSKFQDANVCLFIFDILHFNGENLMPKSMKTRREILEKHIKEIPNRVLLSEMKHITKADDLKHMIAKVIKEGLEGLVLKDVESIYEPGKRHWLKVKKDYLLQGQMADTADLVVLGAYYGTGNKGGLMSVFLMGVHDKKTNRWLTVTKVGNGHDDKTLDRINKQLKVVKISKDTKKIPNWLSVSRSHVPDLVVEDPKKAPVWEITGTEFSKSEAHTADGISIRFPRVTKIRNDKTWENATDLDRLKLLYEKSKEESDVSMLLGIKPDQAPKSSSSRFAANTNKSLLDEGKATFLNDAFRGVKIFVPDSIEGSRLLKRHIIACNGDVVEEYELDDATHAVESQDNVDLPSSVKLVSADYVFECVKRQKLL